LRTIAKAPCPILRPI